MPVTRFDIRLRRPLAGGAAFGEVGPYEELKGTLRFAIDPKHAANERITDVVLAPRDHAGRVEFESDVSILLPVDRGRCSGRVMLDVVNRGNTVAVPNFNRATRPAFVPGADPDPPVDPGDGFLMRRGFVVISCGWQIDLPDMPGLLGLRGPEALDPNGNRITGRVYTQLQTPAPATHLLLSDRGHRPYPAADLDERGAVLLVRDQPDAEAITIERSRWRFARVESGKVVPDARYVWLEGGFEKGRIYQIAYTAIGAPVVGLGIAALRDSAAWLKHGTAREGNPAPGVLRHVYAYGRSQTGRLLRTLVENDLNVDEQGREALDGIIANVAGGLRGEFNQRFGQNSKDRPHMMDYVQPATDEELHRRLAARGSTLKVFYTNSSAEYHRGDASLAHTNAEGTRDVASGPSARVYHFAGTEHGLGVWPPTSEKLAPADPSEPSENSQNLRNTIDYAPLLRACLVNMDRWVTEGVEPPPAVIRAWPMARRSPSRRCTRCSIAFPVLTIRATTRVRAGSISPRCRHGPARRAARSCRPSTPTATRPAASRCQRSRCHSAPTRGGRSGMPRSAAKPSVSCSPARPSRSRAPGASAKPPEIPGRRSRSATGRATTISSASAAPARRSSRSASCSRRTSS